MKASSEAPGGPCLDMGSGGGLPGLALALWWPSSRWLLVDAKQRAARFLEEAVGRLGLESRVQIICDRVEALAASAEHRGRYTLVTARSFGAPALAAEGAAPLLAKGGILVVSEPPPEALDASPTSSRAVSDRWPEIGLDQLGMVTGPHAVCADGFNYQVITQERPCPARYPRRVGVAAKRPLF